ncbi:hypothetical protein AB0O01_22555 [Streptomyces sp. NPDC093252]|uniref:hypothetical protein n=1 Tax=Streptomyces sp. NPDC093252 TaxID=3154980 RepID=UPI00344AC5FE
MAVDPIDPTDPDTFTDEEPRSGEAYDVEAPADDTAEQHADLAPRHDDPLTRDTTEEADEADLAEQARVVSLDEDDYR